MINLTVVIDNDEAIRKLRELQKVAKTTTSSVVKDSERMDASWQQMKNTLMSLTAGVSFAALAKQVVQIRGEVQQLEVAFETMLGSKEKADTLKSEIIDLAAKTPFGLQDVSNATKMLLAYGSTAEEVTGEIKMLGNIASGLSIPLNDLIYLYGTTRTQGRMFTMDLRQFMGRGIPLAEELAKQFGTTKDKVSELVTAGKVGFPEMQRALQAMTSEGGKFNNLMEKQSATITGQISNLQDSIYQMFNEIGQSSEGVISDLISGASWVVEHYQEVLSVLKYIIAAYGLYKAALIAVAAVEHIRTMGLLAKTLFDVARGAQTAAAAFQLLNSSKKGWIGIAAGVVGALAIATMDLSKSSEKAEKQMGALEKAAYNEYIEVNRLVGRLQDANVSENERNSILNKLKTVAPSIVDGLKDEANMTAQLTANLKDYNAEQIKRIQLAALDDKVEDEMKKVGKAKTEFASAQLDWSNTVAEYSARRTSQWTPDVNFVVSQGVAKYKSYSDGLKDRVERQLVAELDKILTDTNTTDAYKSQAVSDYLSKTHILDGVQYKVSGIEGYDLKGAISSLDNARENVRQAETAFDAFVKEDKQLREIIGSVADNTKNDAEAAKTYAQAFADAQKEYLSTQRELAKAIADAKAGKGDITTEAFKDIQARADAAKKAYEELGGVTSTKTQTDKEKRAKEAAKLAIELQNKADQAEIDAMAEGTEKKIAQIEHDYNLRKQAIAKEQAELIAAQGTPLTTEQQSLFNTLNRDNANTYATQLEAAIFGDVDAQGEAAIAKMKADKAAWNEYLAEYGTFQERLKAITIKYNQAIADAQTEGERKTLERERDALLAEYEVAASDWAKELVDKSTNQLNNMLDELQTQVDAKQAAFEALDSSDSATAQEYLKEIDTLKAKIKELQSRIGEADNAAKGENWGAASEVFQGIATACNEAADALEGVDSSLADTFRNMGQVASAAGSLVSAISTVAAASGALQTALGIIGVIAAAIQAVGVIISMFGDEYTLQDTINEAKELNKELERMRKLAQIDSVDGGLFGENAWGNFRNNLKVMGDALKSFRDTQDAIINRGEEYWETINEGELGEFKIRAVKDHTWKDVEDSIRNIQIKTRDRSKAAEFFGALDEYANLGDIAPEIFVGGKVTLEGLQELKNSELWNKISKENQELIDELIANWELYNDSLEATNEYLVSMFGEAGNAIKDALVNAFESGTDAAQQMGDAISDVVERIVNDMVYAATIQPYLDEFTQYMKTRNNWLAQGWITEEKYIEDLTSGAKGLLYRLEHYGSPAYNAMMDAMSDRFGLFDGDAQGQSATQKGFQAMSQDTGDELNGRFTDIQGKVSSIHDAVQFMKSIGSEQLKSLTSIHATVADIRNDTTLIEQHTRVLGQMSDDIASLRRAVVNDGLI